MILLGEAFHYSCEGLNLSFQGCGAWFVTLIVSDYCHRTSKYHATFCLGSGKYGLSPEFPQMAPTDDSENRQLVAQFSRAQGNTCTTQNKKTLGEYRCGTGQRPFEG